jgi:hypothetical protein
VADEPEGGFLSGRAGKAAACIGAGRMTAQLAIGGRVRGIGTSARLLPQQTALASRQRTILIINPLLATKSGSIAAG